MTPDWINELWLDLHEHEPGTPESIEAAVEDRLLRHADGGCEWQVPFLLMELGL